MWKCVCMSVNMWGEGAYIYFLAVFIERARQQRHPRITMNTPSIHILVSKYQSPLKGRNDSLKKLLGPGLEQIKHEKGFIFQEVQKCSKNE